MEVELVEQSTFPTFHLTPGDRRTSLLWRRHTGENHAALQPIQLSLRGKCSSSGEWRLTENRKRERTHDSRRAHAERNLHQNCDSTRRWRLAQTREGAWTYGCHAALVKHHDRTAEKKKHSQVVSKAQSLTFLAVYLFVTSEPLYMHCVRAVVRLSCFPAVSWW